MASIALFEESISRPSRVSSPRMRTSIVAGTAFRRGAGLLAGGTAMVTVQTRANVAVWIERVTAQRARRAPGGNHELRMLSECACFGQGQEDPQRIRGVLAVFEHEILADFLVREREQFHDHIGARAIPGESHRADPEFRINRRREPIALLYMLRAVVRLGTKSSAHLFDQRAQPISQDRHLLLFAEHRDDAAAVDGLHEEFAFAGLPDGTGEEAVG